MIKRIASKALHYTAAIDIAAVFGSFNLWQAPICWAGETVSVTTSENLQTVVNQYPASTTFSLAPGIYRLQSVTPKNNDQFIGQPGAILSGAALLTDFTQNGSYWTAQVSVTEAASYRGECQAANPACMYPEDLFFNSVPKQRVTSLSSVGPGSWYLNYSTGTVYMGDDPAGYTVEVSLLPHAFTGPAQGLIIENLIIEKYAPQAGSGAVDGQSGGAYWTVQSNEIRYNHGMGIGSGNGMYIYENNIHNNGQLGMGGGGSNVLVESNQIAYNNYANYSYFWEAGGAKFCSVTNLKIEYNYSHNNNGPGFWNDINSQGVTYNGNEASANIEAGILFEISNNATITNNFIWNDGFDTVGSTIWYGAGILISNSSNVTITGNTVNNCMNGIGEIMQNRGNGPSGQPYVLENVAVNNNTVTQDTGLAAGIVLGSGYNDSVYTSYGNTFSANRWYLTNPSAAYFFWMGESISLATFNTDL